jgi:hypothetical protein
MAPAPQPHLNKPVVLSPDGKVPEKEVEKSFCRSEYCPVFIGDNKSRADGECSHRYWWVFLGFAVLAMTTGVETNKKLLRNPRQLSIGLY